MVLNWLNLSCILLCVNWHLDLNKPKENITLYLFCEKELLGGRRDCMVVGFTTITMQSVPITAKVVSLNPAHSKVYLMQRYVIKFVE